MLEDDKIFGYEAIINAESCCPRCIDNREDILSWLDELLEEINMKLYDKPWIKRYGEPSVEGYTLLAPINMSSITGHFVPHNKKCYKVEGMGNSI